MQIKKILAFFTFIFFTFQITLKQAQQKYTVDLRTDIFSKFNELAHNILFTYDYRQVCEVKPINHQKCNQFYKKSKEYSQYLSRFLNDSNLSQKYILSYNDFDMLESKFFVNMRVFLSNCKGQIQKMQDQCMAFEQQYARDIYLNIVQDRKRRIYVLDVLKCKDCMQYVEMKKQLIC